VRQDPGWRRSLRSPRTALDRLRILFVAATAPLAVFALPVLLLLGDGDGSGTGFAWIVLADGVMSLALIRWFRSRPLDRSSAPALAGSYRSGMVVGVALSEGIALTGLVGAVVAGESWMWLLGVGLATVGLAWVAPTSYDLARRQAQLDGTGASSSLIGALTPEGAE
jgi:hypothetical protein